MRPRDIDSIEGLTPRQLRVLQCIADFHGRQCYSPTIAELAAELSLSRSTVFEHIAELQRKGLLTTSPGKARSLKLTSRGRRLHRHAADDSPATSAQALSGIPLLGQIAAGIPVEAIENRRSISLASCFSTGGDVFALEVSGDSMIEENICPGDYVVCRAAQTAENGDLVVALVDDGEATLKRFYREKDRVRLQPANSSYEPIYSNNCRIEAVVVGLLRKL
ncbi:MAG: transcriptional repressor LexA [Sedimentisphaerales bacterium]|nr:transcriptional repressor LexA [Sedimentisphaerales bacterium]